jgi:hypothetical protein
MGMAGRSRRVSLRKGSHEEKMLLGMPRSGKEKGPQKDDDCEIRTHAPKDRGTSNTRP